LWPAWVSLADTSARKEVVSFTRFKSNKIWIREEEALATVVLLVEGGPRTRHGSYFDQVLVSGFGVKPRVGGSRSAAGLRHCGPLDWYANS
jgi:hypothetical protein